MSNLKSKFLLGVMTVAIMFVGVVAVKANTAAAATSSCTITTTLKVGSKGAEVKCLQSALGLKADGSFGPMTKKAVMAWQTTQGLVADGVFGHASRAAFSGSVAVTPVTPACPAGQFDPATGKPCGTTTTTTFPAGCTSATGYSATTGVNCATGATTTTPVSNPNVAGSISSDGIVGGYNNTIVGVGDTDHQVAGFQLTGAGGGSNLNLNYATVQLTETGSGSGRLTDYFSAVSIFENGVKVGTVPASAFSSNNSSSLNNVYSASIPLTGATVTAGATSNFYVAVTANSSIDSVNFTGGLTNNWEVAVNNIRFTDGTGLTLTYSPSSYPSGIGSLGTAAQFSFGSAATANNIILNVERASSDSNSHTVSVNQTGGTTQKVPLLAFTVSDQGGQTVSINKFPVVLTVSTGNVSAVTPEVYLMNGTTVLDSENVSGANTSGQNYNVYFKNFSTPLLVNGTQQTLTVAADINAIGVNNTNYAAGTSLLATTVVGSSSATGYDLSVGSPTGTEIAATSSIVPGAAYGQQVAFYANGVSVAVNPYTCGVTTQTVTGGSPYMTCTIPFTVTASGAPAFIPQNGSATGSFVQTAMNFAAQASNGVLTGLTPNVSISQVGTNATLSTGAAGVGATLPEYTLNAGQTASFTASFILTDPSGTHGGSQYRAFLTSIPWGTQSGQWTNTYSFNLGSTNTSVPGYTYMQ